MSRNLIAIAVALLAAPVYAQSDWHDVTAYGATPNDGSDDSNAINAAIHAALTSASQGPSGCENDTTNDMACGGTVFFPAGVYDIDGTLDISRRNTTRRGGIRLLGVSGQNSPENLALNSVGRPLHSGSVLRVRQNTYPAVFIEGWYPDPMTGETRVISSIVFEHLSFVTTFEDWQTGCDKPPFPLGVYVSCYSANVSFVRTTMSNFCTAIQFGDDTCPELSVRGLSIDDGGAWLNTRALVTRGGSVHTTIRNTRFGGWRSESEAAHSRNLPLLDIEGGAGDVQISNVRLFHGLNSIRIGKTPFNIQVDSSVLEAATLSHILVDDDFGETPVGLQVSNSWFGDGDNVDQHALELRNTAQVLFSNNRVGQQRGESSVYIANTRDVILSSNFFDNDGVLIWAGSTNFSARINIMGNNFVGGGSNVNANSNIKHVHSIGNLFSGLWIYGRCV